MVFCIVLEVIQMRYNANVAGVAARSAGKNETAAQIDSVRAEMMEQMKRDADGDAAAGASAEGAKAAAAERIRPVIIGNNVYVMHADGRRGRRIVQGAHGLLEHRQAPPSTPRWR